MCGAELASVAPIIAATLGLYNPCKEVFLFAMSRHRHIKALEERISELIVLLSLISTEKGKIDRFLRNSVLAEESQAYTVVKAEIDVITSKYVKFIAKYEKSTTNQLTSTTELNLSTEALMISQLSDLKSKVMTKNCLKLAKLSGDVAKLSKRASAVAVPFKPENMTREKSEPIKDMLGGDGVVLPVFDMYVEKVLEHLLGGAHTVVISGRKGVGKTTVYKRLHDRVSEQKEQWGDIIRVNYPADTETDEGVMALQSEIISQLTMSDYREATKNKDNDAKIISAYLRKRKYILLMDHVSKNIDLDKVGIRRNHGNRRVVICSRVEAVISKMADEVVEIKGLENVEARELFENIYGELSVHNLPSMDKITGYCGGVVGMLNIIARYLKDNQANQESWGYVERVLSAECTSHELSDLAEFDKGYDITYQALSTTDRRCLLYGALFPYQHHVYTDYLTECWIAEGLIDERSDQKVRCNRARGQGLLDRLTKLHMLEWYTRNNVMVSPDFRRVAVQKKYAEDFWVPSRNRSPDTDDWGRVTRMSLIGCDVKLPPAPNSPNMCTLLLQSLEPSLKQLGAVFFINMKSLKVLDLSCANIQELPGSIKKLESLKSLYLKGCPLLVALPPEADQLKEIEFLDISGTAISRLPQEIGSMVKMRCLRASLSAKNGGASTHDPKGKQVVESDELNQLIIPPCIISNLENLEELSIYTPSDFQLGDGEAESLAMELAGLKHLNTLCFNFPNVSSLDTFVTHSKALKNTQTSWGTLTFRSFKIFIGCQESRRADEPDFSGIISEKWLRYSTDEEFSENCQELLKQAHTFEIIGHDGIQSFTCSQFDLHPVKVCMVERCKNLENIVDRGRINKNQSSLLPNLEKLYLYDLESLKCIWNGTGPSTSLVHLKAITIDACPNLAKILDPKSACSLQRLEYLKVENCSKISKIIEGRGEPSNSEQEGLLIGLRKIELSNLPLLQNIYASSSRNLKSQMYTSDLPVPPETLANLTTITIHCCPKLTKVLDSALARSLQRLQYLKVDNCDQISEIIEGGSAEQVELLQSLKEIELSNLPLLQSICESESISISCKSLKSITVLRCSNLTNLHSLTLTDAIDNKLPLITCEKSWWNELQIPDELREHLFCNFEEEISQPSGEEASTSRRSSEMNVHRMFSNTTSTSNMSAAQSRGEASTSGRGWETTEHGTSSNGAQSRGEVLANRSSSEITESRMVSNATSMSNMNDAPSIEEPLSPEFLPDRVSKGCFPTWGCS